MQCKSCNAEIKFITTENGRKMPVDLPAITVITSLGKTIKAFAPHWATCNDADGFRKKQRGGSHA